ncbi:MAG: BatD family protein [Rhizobacter sp.]|nr:BatD family protein [Rhizobacter sp.]
MARQATRFRRGRGPFAKLRLAVLATALLGAAHAGWAAVSASLDRSSVPLGQPLTLTIESEGSPSGAKPDLEPLRKDFDLLSSSQSSEIRIINFHRSDRMRWTVQLLPRRQGSIDIAPITVGSEQTGALQLQVAAPAAAANPSGAADTGSAAPGTAVFMEVDSAAEGKPVYVQQQVPYTVRLYADGSVRSGNLTAPTSPDAVIEQLGAEERKTVTLHGRDYTLIERHYAISPEKSGTLRIAPAVFRGSAEVPRNPARDDGSGDDLMAEMLRNSPFANNPALRNGLLGGLSLGATMRPVAASAQTLTLDVRPRPAGAQAQWLPAEQIRLHDSWADGAPVFKAGEPVTRTLTIEAKGLAASQIPALTLAQPANARLYADAPDNQSRTDGTTIYGISKQTVTYIPTAAGTLDVAPAELPWWDTRDNVQRRAEVAAQHFQVAPGVAPAVPSVATGATPVPSAAATASTTTAAAKSPGEAAASWQARAAEAIRDHGAWAASGLALLLGGGITVWWMRRRATPGVPSTSAQAPTAPPPPGTRASLRSLQQACRDGDREAAARALLELARAEWPERPPRGLGELADRIDAGADEVRALDRSLYGAATRAWDGTALWQALGKGLRQRRQGSPGQRSDALAPLYP